MTISRSPQRLPGGVAIWNPVLTQALAGRPTRRFAAPEGVVWAETTWTRQARRSRCPRIVRSILGAPTRRLCELHRF